VALCALQVRRTDEVPIRQVAEPYELLVHKTERHGSGEGVSLPGTTPGAMLGATGRGSPGLVESDDVAPSLELVATPWLTQGPKSHTMECPVPTDRVALCALQVASRVRRAREASGRPAAAVQDEDDADLVATSMLHETPTNETIRYATAKAALTAPPQKPTLLTGASDYL
jgi:hypothetical protein